MAGECAVAGAVAGDDGGARRMWSAGPPRSYLLLLLRCKHSTVCISTNSAHHRNASSTEPIETASTGTCSVQRTYVRPYESVHEPHRAPAEQLALEVTQRLPAIAALAGSVRVEEEGVQERSAQASLHARDPCCSGAWAAHTTGLCGVGRHNSPGSAARVNEALEVQ